MDIEANLGRISDSAPRPRDTRPSTRDLTATGLLT